MAYQAIGNAINRLIRTSFKKCHEIMETISFTDAPITFRIPISLVRNSMTISEMAKRPRQERKMAIPEAIPKIVAMARSPSYQACRFSSKKEALKTAFAVTLSQTDESRSIVEAGFSDRTFKNI